MRLGLIPPIDVEGLVKRYANLTEARFPVDVDGICLDLKIPGKQPRVIINSYKPENRVRFTLAHELGHILIPWHIESIVDETNLDQNGVDYYWQIESEANRFASELLMPRAWMEDQLNAASDPLEALHNVVDNAVVSVQAATIKIMNMIPEGHILARLDDDGFLISSMRSPGTLADAPPIGTEINPEIIFPWARQWRREFSGRRFVWWAFPDDVPVPMIQTTREWREILNAIIIDLAPPEIEKFKSTLNGILAFSNGSVRRSRTEGTVLTHAFSACIVMRRINPYIEEFLAHDLFNEFIVARIRDFLK